GARARGRGAGERHLLRAAHRRRRDRGGPGAARAAGRRRGHRLRAGLPDRRHRLRRRERSGLARLAPARRPAHLRGAERARHAAAHPLSGAHRQSQPGAAAAMTTHADALLPAMQSDEELTRELVAPVGPGRRWLARALLFSGAVTALLVLAMAYT